MRNLYQINDIVEILSGLLAGLEGHVVGTPKLTNFYTYSVQINGHTVGGLKQSQLGLAVQAKTFTPTPDVADVVAAATYLTTGPEVLEVSTQELLAPVDETYQGGGGSFGGGGASADLDTQTDSTDGVTSNDSSPDFDSNFDSGDSGSW